MNDHDQALHDTGFWGKQGAGALFLSNETKNILIAHRSSMVQEPLTWGTWGGAIDEGENPATAVIREAYEELGYDARNDKIIPLYIFNHSSGFKYYNFLIIVGTEFTPRLNWESEGYVWAQFGDWPQPIHPGLKALLSDPKSINIIKQYTISVA